MAASRPREARVSRGLLRLRGGSRGGSGASNSETQDCCENALEELGLGSVKLLKHVYHGDTLYAFSLVAAKEDDPRGDAGIVTFEHYGYRASRAS